MALAVFSGDARTVVDPTTDRQAMREALGGLAPGAGPTRFGSVLELARGLSGGRQTELVVVSDFPASIAAESRRLWLNDGMGLRLERIAPPVADLRVVSLRRTDTGVAALVEAEGAGRRESVVSLVLDGRESGRRVVPFEAGGVVEVAFDAELPAAGVLSVRVQDPGGRPAGDERFLVLDPRPPLRVLMIQPVGTLPEASLYVREALAAEPSGAFSTEVRMANDPTLCAPDWTESTSAVVLLGTRGIDRRARDQVTEFARRGGGILIAAGASTEALAVRDLLGREISHALKYNELLASVKQIKTPKLRPETFHIFHLYVIRPERRDDLAAFLKTKGVATGIHYPYALPLMPAYRYLRHQPSDFPVAYECQGQILSLPMYPELTDEQIAYVADTIAEFYKK